MRVIPVIDLMNGQVVRAVAGRRSEYQPIQSRIAADPRPATVARAFVERFGFETVYVADLDAITKRNLDVASWRQIADAGLRLILDAGVRDVFDAECILNCSQNTELDVRLVIGLETLESEQDLTAIKAVCSAQPPLFSLDMQDGQVLSKLATWRALSPLEIAAKANGCGAGDIIILDLADVGAGRGTRTVELCRAIRQQSKTRTIIAGGGVRGMDDLTALADAGCDAALVASALHDGRLTPEAISQFENRQG